MTIEPRWLPDGPPPRPLSLRPAALERGPGLHNGSSVSVDGRRFFRCQTCGWVAEWWNHEPSCGLAKAQSDFLIAMERAAAEVMAEQTRGQRAAQELARAQSGERR